MTEARHGIESPKEEDGSETSHYEFKEREIVEISNVKVGLFFAVRVISLISYLIIPGKELTYGLYIPFEFVT